MAYDNRPFINALFWIMRTEATWRDPPPDLSHWINISHPFIRWRDKGSCEKLLEILIDEPEYGGLMPDTSHIKG